MDSQKQEHQGLLSVRQKANLLTRLGQDVRQEVSKPEFVILRPGPFPMVVMIQEVEAMHCNDTANIDQQEG